MMGVLGNYFIAKRIFETILLWSGVKPGSKNRCISLPTYVEYSDVLYNGRQKEKDKISFMMLDLRGEGQIDFKQFEVFWMNFLYMYGQIL
jgi:hypothetical protein